MGQGEHSRMGGESTPEEEHERFSPGGLSFEEALRRILFAGPDMDDSRAAWEELLGGKGASRRLSDEERRQLEQRARERLTDPEYRRRLEESDRILDSLRREPEQ